MDNGWKVSNQSTSSATVTVPCSAGVSQTQSYTVYLNSVAAPGDLYRGCFYVSAGSSGSSSGYSSSSSPGLAPQPGPDCPSG
jgi:hypothetical protein